MTDGGFLRRDCPCCRASGSAGEIASERAAETLSLAELRPLWAGLDHERVFFTYRRCAECALLYNPAYFTSDALAALYSDLAPNMDMVPPDMLADTQRAYFDRMAQDAELTGGYLEIGPDVGYIVAEAAKRGEFEHFWLYEPNRTVHGLLREAAGGRPATVSADMTDLSAVPDGSVGLAVMIHVLDHLLDPLGMIRQILRKLRPGGLLVTVTHDEASMLRRLLGTKWPPFCLQHPQLFNPRTVGRLLREAGLERIATSGTSNLFPADFLAGQAARAIGFDMRFAWMPSVPVRFRLGNMMAFARAPLDQAAAASPERERQRA